MEERGDYLIGIAADELLPVVTSVALVNDARKFDVNCEANALISIDETLISGPTRIKEDIFRRRKVKTDVMTNQS